MFDNITVNGVPLKAVVDAEDRREKMDFRSEEVAGMARTIKAHITTKSNWNTSGTRSGKGRVIVQNGVWL